MMRRISSKPVSFTIAIVGGGFSGTILASLLLRSGQPAIRVVVIEREGCLGRGVAYGTVVADHLLNVPAKDMSALGDDPSHFLRWVREHYNDQARPDDYLPRRIYGIYVESILREAIQQNPGRFEWRRDEALSITTAESGATIVVGSGSSIHADAVVLSLGNFPPNACALPGGKEVSRCFVPDPWAGSVLDQVGPENSVLLIGSGLSSVDIVIALRSRGFRGKIHMLSRHGLLPQTHRLSKPWPARWDQSPAGGVRSLLRRIRSEVAKAERQNCDWRAVIDSMRPFAESIWRSLPHQERRRFLRHLRSYWDAHRHRVAPEIGRVLQAEMAQDRLEIHGGRIIEYREKDDSAELSYRSRGDCGAKKLSVDYVINCTGPDEDCRRVESPLLCSLLNQNLVRPGPLCLGLDTGDNGALLNADGVPSDWLYTVGPLRKGNLWETTAVPEIRVQVSKLAFHLQSRFEPRYPETGSRFNQVQWPVPTRDQNNNKRNLSVQLTNLEDAG